jgi:hypothetical protein
MKSSWRSTLGLVIVVGLGLAPAASWGITSEVFRVDTTLQGVIQSGPVSNSIIEKVKIRSEDLVNLAQGRTLGTAVPKNEILAFANDCLVNLRMIVYDTDTASNLVTIGQAINLSTAFSSRKRYEETIHSFSINDTTPGGGGSNGIVGGSFYYHGKININTNFCPTKFGGQFTGVLRTAFPFIATNIFCTNFVDSCTVTNCVLTNCLPDCVTNCTTNCVSHSDCWTNIFPAVELIPVIIPRSPISTGKKIGTLVEP